MSLKQRVGTSAESPPKRRKRLFLIAQSIRLVRLRKRRQRQKSLKQRQRPWPRRTPTNTAGQPRQSAQWSCRPLCCASASSEVVLNNVEAMMITIDGLVVAAFTDVRILGASFLPKPLRTSAFWEPAF